MFGEDEETFKVHKDILEDSALAEVSIFDATLHVTVDKTGLGTWPIYCFSNTEQQAQVSAAVVKNALVAEDRGVQAGHVFFTSPQVPALLAWLQLHGSESTFP